MRLAAPTVLAVALAVAAACDSAATGDAGSPMCQRPPVELVPLTDLAAGLYHGFWGGLYPGGRNAPPARYLALGRARAARIVPRDAAGNPSPAGKIVLLSVGMSNAEEEFGAFQYLARLDPGVSPAVTLVNGAQGREDARRAADADSSFWPVLERRLALAEVTDAQVQAVWLKEAIAFPNGRFPADARALEADLRTTVGLLRQRFPDLQIVYLSSRTYGGYATFPLQPEPYAYDSGFAVKWLVEQRMDNRLRGPWLGWGPYLWTDGTKGRRDGFVWTCADVAEDGIHPSASGRLKVARLLLAFFTSDPTARPWFVERVPRPATG